jgi:hypothetical protein
MQDRQGIVLLFGLALFTWKGNDRLIRGKSEETRVRRVTSESNYETSACPTTRVPVFIISASRPMGCGRDIDAPLIMFVLLFLIGPPEASQKVN